MEYCKNLSLENLFYINDDGLICLEEWRDIPSYIGIYQASNIGRCKSFKANKEKILKQSLSGNRYLSVGLSKKGDVTQFLIQVLVAMAFLNHTPCGYEKIVDHIDNDSLNNKLSNLQIITSRINSSKEKTTMSGFLGVYRTNNGKFSPHITFDGKSYNLGVFNTPEEASEIREKAISLHSTGDNFLDVKSVKTISLYKGVYVKKNKFYARVCVNGKHINIGSFNSKEEGYLAREKYLIENNIKYA